MYAFWDDRLLETKQIMKYILAITVWITFTTNVSWGESVCLFGLPVDPATDALLDRTTPEKLCAEYCPENSAGLPAYCNLSKQKFQEQTIYDNCVIAKGSNLMNNQAFDSIKKSCERISKKPSFLQKLRWGS